MNLNTLKKSILLSYVAVVLISLLMFIWSIYLYGLNDYTYYYELEAAFNLNLTILIISTLLLIFVRTNYIEILLIKKSYSRLKFIHFSVLFLELILLGQTIATVDNLELILWHLEDHVIYDEVKYYLVSLGIINIFRLLMVLEIFILRIIKLLNFSKIMKIDIDEEHTGTNQNKDDKINEHEQLISPVILVLLNIITFGIYYLIYIAKTQNKLNQKFQDKYSHTSGLEVIMYIILTFGFYIWVWLYHTYNRIEKITNKNDFLKHFLCIIPGGLMIIPILLAPAVLATNVNKALKEDVTNDE